MTDKQVGVIGAGVMGSGVAQNLAQKGFKVVLVDIADAALERAKKEIYNNVRFQGFMKKDKSRLDNPDDIISKIVFTTDYGLT